MACGTVRNTYRTLAGLEVVLLSGTRVDTTRPDADAHLAEAEPALVEGLLRLRDRVRGNPDSVRTITHQFSMKNTMGAFGELIPTDFPSLGAPWLLSGLVSLYGRSGLADRIRVAGDRRTARS